MRGRRVVVACCAVAALAAIGGGSAGARYVNHHHGGDGPGFKTSAPPGLVGLASGVLVDPILTAGDVVGDYQMTGIPDGGGIWKGPDGWQWVINHEHADKTAYPSTDAADNFGARVSQLWLSHDAGIRRARHVVRGTEGYVWFCSGNLTVLDGRPWYFTGEEGTFGTHSGTSAAVDVRNGTYKDLPWFGFFAHEQEVPVTGLGEATFALPEDGPKSKSQFYEYTARTWSQALNGSGTLRVFVPDGPAPDGDWSTNDIARGQSISGHFEPLDQFTDNANPAALEAAAQAKGAFDFVRVEDATPTDRRGVVYFSDTGSIGHATVKGRIYRMEMDPRDPSAAKLTLVLDGDAGDNIVNPDNVGAHGNTLMIQEDRNAEHRFSATMGAQTGYSRVLAYDIKTGALRVVARVATPASIAATKGEGEWESSGVIDASPIWGRGWWLLTVQEHSTSVPQAANPALVPNTTTGEGGQLLRIYVPGT
jgi:hypothetical protein